MTRILRAIKSFVRSTITPLPDIESFVKKLYTIRTYSFTSENIKGLTREILYGSEESYNGLDLILEFKYHLNIYGMDTDELRFIEEQIKVINGMTIFQYVLEDGETYDPAKLLSNLVLDGLRDTLVLLYILRMHIRYIESELNLLRTENEQQIYSR